MDRSSFKNKKEKKQNGEDVVREHVEVEKCQSDVTIDPEPSVEPVAHSSVSAEESKPPVVVETQPILIPDPVEVQAHTPVKEETPVEPIEVTKVQQSEPIPPPLPPKKTSLSEVEIDEPKLSPRTLSLSEAILEELDLTLENEKEQPNDAEGSTLSHII